MRRRAFTLSEVLMALALFALVLVTALVVLHWALAGSQRQHTMTRAAFLAQQQMEAWILESRPQATQGQFPAPYADFRWRGIVRDEPPFLKLQLEVSGPRAVAYRLCSERRQQLRWLAFHSNDNLFLLDEDRPDPELLCHLPCSGEFSLSPDGQWVAYIAPHRGKNQIFLKALYQKQPAELLFELPSGAAEPSFSTDSQSLAFTTFENGHSQVFVGSLARRSWHNWSRSPFDERSPTWHSNGKDLIVCRSNSSIWLRSSNGSTSVLVEETNGWNASPQLAKDGTLVFMSSRDGDPEIYSLVLPSKQVRRLTENPAYDTFPQIAPDGKRIVFQSNRGGAHRIYSMNLDGTEVTPLTPEMKGEHPHWLGL